MNPSITISRCEVDCKSDQEISEFVKDLNVVVLLSSSRYNSEVYDGQYIEKYIQFYTQKVFESP